MRRTQELSHPLSKELSGKLYIKALCKTATIFDETPRWAVIDTLTQTSNSYVLGAKIYEPNGDVTKDESIWGRLFGSIFNNPVRHLPKYSVDKITPINMQMYRLFGEKLKREGIIFNKKKNKIFLR